MSKYLVHLKLLFLIIFFNISADAVHASNEIKNTDQKKVLIELLKRPSLVVELKRLLKQFENSSESKKESQQVAKIKMLHDEIKKICNNAEKPDDKIFCASFEAASSKLHIKKAKLENFTDYENKLIKYKTKLLEKLDNEINKDCFKKVYEQYAANNIDAEKYFLLLQVTSALVQKGRSRQNLECNLSIPIEKQQTENIQPLDQELVNAKRLLISLLPYLDKETKNFETAYNRKIEIERVVSFLQALSTFKSHSEIIFSYITKDQGNLVKALGLLSQNPSGTKKTKFSEIKEKEKYLKNSLLSSYKNEKIRYLVLKKLKYKKIIANAQIALNKKCGSIIEYARSLIEEPNKDLSFKNEEANCKTLFEILGKKTIRKALLNKPILNIKNKVQGAVLEYTDELLHKSHNKTKELFPFIRIQIRSRDLKSGRAIGRIFLGDPSKDKVNCYHDNKNNEQKQSLCDPKRIDNEKRKDCFVAQTNQTFGKNEKLPICAYRLWDTGIDVHIVIDNQGLIQIDRSIPMSNVKIAEPQALRQTLHAFGLPSQLSPENFISVSIENLQSMNDLKVHVQTDLPMPIFNQTQRTVFSISIIKNKLHINIDDTLDQLQFSFKQKIQNKRLVLLPAKSPPNKALFSIGNINPLPGNCWQKGLYLYDAEITLKGYESWRVPLHSFGKEKGKAFDTYVPDHIQEEILNDFRTTLMEKVTTALETSGLSKEIEDRLKNETQVTLHTDKFSPNSMVLTGRVHLKLPWLKQKTLSVNWKWDIKENTLPTLDTKGIAQLAKKIIEQKAKEKLTSWAENAAKDVSIKVDITKKKLVDFFGLENAVTVHNFNADTRKLILKINLGEKDGDLYINDIYVGNIKEKNGKLKIEKPDFSNAYFSGSLWENYIIGLDNKLKSLLPKLGLHKNLKVEIDKKFDRDGIALFIIYEGLPKPLQALSKIKITVGPNGVRSENIKGIIKEKINQIIKDKINNDLVFEEFGPLKNVTLTADVDKEFRLKLHIASAKLKLSEEFYVGFSAKNLFPGPVKVNINPNSIEEHLFTELLKPVAKLGQLKCPSNLQAIKKAPFGIKFDCEVKFPALGPIKLTDIKLTTKKFDLPPAMSFSIGGPFPVGPFSMVDLMFTLNTKYPARIELDGDFVPVPATPPLVPKTVSQIVKIDASAKVDLEAFKSDLKGQAVLLDYIPIFSAKANMNLRDYNFNYEGKTLGEMRKLLDLNIKGSVDMKEGILRNKSKLKVLGLELNQLDFDIGLYDGYAHAEAKTRVLLSDLNASLDMEPGLTNPQIGLGGNIKIDKHQLANLNININLHRALMAFKVFGIQLSLSVPTVKELTQDRILHMILSLFNFDIDAMLKALENQNYKIVVGGDFGEGGEPSPPSQGDDGNKEASGKNRDKVDNTEEQDTSQSGEAQRSVNACNSSEKCQVAKLNKEEEKGRPKHTSATNEVKPFQSGEYIICSKPDKNNKRWIWIARLKKTNCNVGNNKELNKQFVPVLASSFKELKESGFKILPWGPIAKRGAFWFINDDHNKFILLLRANGLKEHVDKNGGFIDFSIEEFLLSHFPWLKVWLDSVEKNKDKKSSVPEINFPEIKYLNSQVNKKYILSRILKNSTEAIPVDGRVNKSNKYIIQYCSEGSVNCKSGNPDFYEFLNSEKPYWKRHVGSGSKLYNSSQIKTSVMHDKLFQNNIAIIDININDDGSIFYVFLERKEDFFRNGGWYYLINNEADKIRKVDFKMIGLAQINPIPYFSKATTIIEIKRLVDKINKVSSGMPLKSIVISNINNHNKQKQGIKFIGWNNKIRVGFLNNKSTSYFKNKTSNGGSDVNFCPNFKKFSHYNLEYNCPSGYKRFYYSNIQFCGIKIDTDGSDQIANYYERFSIRMYNEKWEFGLGTKLLMLCDRICKMNESCNQWLGAFFKYKGDNFSTCSMYKELFPVRNFKTNKNDCRVFSKGYYHLKNSYNYDLTGKHWDTTVSEIKTMISRSLSVCENDNTVKNRLGQLSKYFQKQPFNKNTLPLLLEDWSGESGCPSPWEVIVSLQEKKSERKNEKLTPPRQQKVPKIKLHLLKDHK